MLFIDRLRFLPLAQNFMPLVVIKLGAAPAPFIINLP